MVGGCLTVGGSISPCFCPPFQHNRLEASRHAYQHLPCMIAYCRGLRSSAPAGAGRISLDEEISEPCCGAPSSVLGDRGSECRSRSPVGGPGNLNEFMTSSRSESTVPDFRGCFFCPPCLALAGGVDCGGTSRGRTPSTGGMVI
jgi:hypothetical protein